MYLACEFVIRGENTHNKILILHKILLQYFLFDLGTMVATEIPKLGMNFLRLKMTKGVVRGTSKNYICHMRTFCSSR